MRRFFKYLRDLFTWRKKDNTKKNSPKAKRKISKKISSEEIIKDNSTMIKNLHPSNSVPSNEAFSNSIKVEKVVPLERKQVQVSFNSPKKEPTAVREKKTKNINSSSALVDNLSNDEKRFSLSDTTRTSLLSVEISKSKRNIKRPNIRPPNQLRSRNDSLGESQELDDCLSSAIPVITVHEDDINRQSDDEDKVIMRPRVNKFHNFSADELNGLKSKLTTRNSNYEPTSRDANNITVDNIMRNRKSERLLPKPKLNDESRKSFNIVDTAAPTDFVKVIDKADLVRKDAKLRNATNSKSMFVVSKNADVKTTSDIIGDREGKIIAERYNYRRRESKDDLLLAMRPTLIAPTTIKSSSKSDENLNEVDPKADIKAKNFAQKFPPGKLVTGDEPPALRKPMEGDKKSNRVTSQIIPPKKKKVPTATLR